MPKVGSQAKRAFEESAILSGRRNGIVWNPYHSNRTTGSNNKVVPTNDKEASGPTKSSPNKRKRTTFIKLSIWFRSSLWTVLFRLVVSHWCYRGKCVRVSLCRYGAFEGVCKKTCVLADFFLLDCVLRITQTDTVAFYNSVVRGKRDNSAESVSSSRVETQLNHNKTMTLWMVLREI